MGIFARALFMLLIAAPAPPAAGPHAADPSSAYPSAEALGHYVQARLALERGEETDALAEFYRVLGLDPRALSANRSVSEISARAGEAARSLEFAERALALDPDDTHSQWLKGSALFNLGRSDEALQVLEAAALSDSTEVQYWLTLARVAEQMDRIPVVARAYRRVVDLDEDDAESWFQLAGAETRLAHYGAADSALARAVELNPMRPGQLFLQGWIRESTGRRSEAITLYRRHLELHPDDQATRGRIVDLLTRERRYAEAYDEVRKLTKARPSDLDALEGECDLAFKVNRPREAEAAVDRLRRLRPDDPATVSRATEVLARNGRGREAVAMAEAWAAAHPKDPRGEMVIAQTHALSHQPGPAIEHGRRAVDAAPDSLAPRVLLARIYQGEKRYADAEREWSQALERYPRLSGLALDLAFCREQMGDLEGAASAVRDVLQREPDNSSALNFLGYLYADHNLHLDQAEQLIQRAVDLEPDNGAYLDSLGWVYYRLGRLLEARVRLERAAQLTGDPVVYEHLGDVYKDLKLLDLAKTQYTRALERDSSNTRLRSKLAEIR